MIILLTLNFDIANKGYTQTETEVGVAELRRSGIAMAFPMKRTLHTGKTERILNWGEGGWRGAYTLVGSLAIFIKLLF